MTKSERLDHLLNRIEMGCNPEVGLKQSSDFMMECLSLIKSKLPRVASEGLRISNEYIAGRAQRESIIEALEKCWSDLRENHSGQQINEHEVSGIRATICLLHAQAHPHERDIVDQLSFFLTLVNNVEPHFEKEEFLLRRHFAQCLITGE